MNLDGISQTQLSRMLVAGKSRSDMRSAIRAWANGTRRITADNAFLVGEALGALRSSHVCGVVAVLIAGHFHDYALLLQRLLAKSMECDDEDKEDLYNIRYEIGEFGAAYVPLVAEVELFEAIGGRIDDSTDISLFHARTGSNRDTERIARKDRFVKRALRHGRFALRSLGWSSSGKHVVPAWRTRFEAIDFTYEPLRQSSDLVRIIGDVAEAPHLNPEVGWRAARALLREWPTLVIEDFAASRRIEIDALEGLIDHWGLATCMTDADEESVPAA
jgi:hypothetical protein